MDKDVYHLNATEAAKINHAPESLRIALQNLAKDHDFLKAGNVFTQEFVDTWIDYKMTREVKEVQLRPHPYEFHLYYETATLTPEPNLNKAYDLNAPPPVSDGEKKVSENSNRDVKFISNVPDVVNRMLVAVTISIPTLNKEIATVMEPRTSTPSRRLQTVETLSKAGIFVNVNIAPIIPGLTDDTIPFVIKSSADAGAKSAARIILRLPWQNKDLFIEWVNKNFPDRANKILNRVKSLRGGELYNADWGTRMRGEGEWAETVKQIFRINCDKYNLNKERAELVTDLFRRNPEQEKLF
ncbi:unnamed protein product [Rotaria sp. Silwood1]|nr:unnamed protein product [Rotaria sp. Silwood1]